MLQQTGEAAARGDRNLVRRDLPWVMERREQPRGSSVTVHAGSAACMNWTSAS